MKSMICLLTYRRLPALQEMLRGIQQYCPHYQLAVFEDCGQRDGTSAFLSRGRELVARPELLAAECVLSKEKALEGMSEDERSLGVEPNIPRFFLGDENLGVAGNSNRAIKHFMDSDCDHLCLCNDDLHVLGDFVNFYRQGHSDLDVGLFCFCPSGGQYSHESYKWVTVRSRGYIIRLMPRITGIMISITRKLIEKVGYFDTRFGKFGNEHVDYTYRCRFAGGINLDGQDQGCLDIEPATPLLQHQEVATSVTGNDRVVADRESIIAMQAAAARYAYEHYHRPFALKTPQWVGAFGHGIPGIPFADLGGYHLAPAASV